MGMASEILPIAATAGASADIVVAANSSLTVGLKFAGPANNGRVMIELKSDTGDYFAVDELAGPGRAAVMIVAPGTYRFVRVVNGASVGVFSG
jgi:hypothetical protein